MKKVYLVVRKYYNKENIANVTVNEAFTSLKKAKALKRYFDAVDNLDKKMYPTLKETIKSKTEIVTLQICNFDFTRIAKSKEIELELLY